MSSNKWRIRKKPNFFIIGAPRCGTTSLSYWLSQHTNVYISSVKEPFFYSPDVHRPAVAYKSEYERLFDGVSSEHIAIGEASTTYLFSRIAVPSIEEEIPNSKYIVIVRSHIEMAVSLYRLNVAICEEQVDDFETAWRLSPLRTEGKMLGPLCKNPLQLDYQSVCRLGEQVERLLRLVPCERVLVLVLDDIRVNPRFEYVKVLKFLSLPDDGRQSFEVRNEGRVPRWERIHFWVMSFIRWYGEIVKRYGMPSVRGTGIINAVFARRPKERFPTLSDNFLNELVEYYRSDIEKLGRILGRDLSYWLELRRYQSETVK